MISYVYVIRGLHQEFDSFEERYSSYAESLRRYCYYASTGIPVSLYREDSESFSGVLLMRSFGFEVEQECCHE